jgi:hypothetical protein
VGIEVSGANQLPGLSQLDNPFIAGEAPYEPDDRSAAGHAVPSPNVKP